MSYPSYLDTVPALNAILQTLQNLQVVTYVSGVVVGAIETGYVGVNIVNSAIQVPVQIQSSLINVPITGVIGGTVNVGNTPLPITGYVSIENVPNVIVNTGYVGVDVLNQPTVIVGNTVNVAVVNTPSVTVSNTPLPVTGYISIENVPSVIVNTGYVGVNIVNSAIQVPVQIQSSLINVPITGVVGGAVTVSNTPLPITGYVSIENVPTVIVQTGFVGVNILNQPTVTVGNTVNVAVVNTPSVNIANVPSVVVNTGYVGVNIVGSQIQVPITGVVGGTVNVGNTPLPVLNAGAQSVMDTVVWLNTTFYTASPPSTTYSTAINVVPYETVSVLFNVVSLLGTGVTVSLNAYFTGLGMVYPLASQTLTSTGQALLTASVLPFNYIELGVTLYGSTVVLSAELVAKP